MSFGGGGGSKPQTTTSTSVQELSPEQRQLIELVIPKASTFINNPPTTYPGTTIAPQTELERQAQGQALEAAGRIANVADAATLSQQMLANPFATSTGLSDPEVRRRLLATPSTNPAVTAIQNRLLVNPMKNPALEGAAQAAINPLITNFQRSVLPGIRSGAVQSGGFGSSRQGVAEGIASGDLMKSIGDVSSTFANQAFRDILSAETTRLGSAADLTGQVAQSLTGAETARLGTLASTDTARGTAALEASTRSLLAAPQTAALALEPARITESVGAQQRAEQQARINEEVQKFMANQLLPFAATQEVAGLAFGMPGGSVASTATGPGLTQPSYGQRALGGAATGASLGAMFGPWGAGIGAGVGALASLF